MNDILRAFAELVGHALQESVRECGLPEGVFSLLFGSGPRTGMALITHPSILLFPDEAEFELDVQMLHEVWPDLQALRQQRTTTIFVTPRRLRCRSAYVHGLHHDAP